MPAEYMLTTETALCSKQNPFSHLRDLALPVFPLGLVSGFGFQSPGPFLKSPLGCHKVSRSLMELPGAPALLGWESSP